MPGILETAEGDALLDDFHHFHRRQVLNGFPSVKIGIDGVVVKRGEGTFVRHPVAPQDALGDETWTF